MGTIAPNSRVYLLEGVPLDNTYENTIHFASVTQQRDFYLNTSSSYYNYNPRLITPLSYQRVNEGVLRVNLSYDQLYNVNYMMFQNTTQNSKWFYAFVLNVEYVNEQASNIYYELDVMQTWYFEAILQPSYIERCHFPTDGIDEHLELEDVSLGDIVCDVDSIDTRLNDYAIIITHADLGES